ncbi:MAG: hypothetical protein JWM10_3006 [Myxococcaceae bacterium]|nr:hypothetical protein [Myxococcaceae bacterium]
MAAKTREQPETAPADELVPVQFRFSRALLALLDARLRAEQAARPGLSMTRSDLVRDILFEAVKAPLPKPKRGAKGEAP